MAISSAPQYAGVESEREYRRDGGITTLRPPTDVGADFRNSVRTPGQRADLLLGIDDPAESRIADGKVRENRGLIGTPYPSSSMAGLAAINAKSRALMPLTQDENAILSGVQGVGKYADLTLTVLLRPDFSDAVRLAGVYRHVKSADAQAAPQEVPAGRAQVRVTEAEPYVGYSDIRDQLANVYAHIMQAHHEAARQRAASVSATQAALDPSVHAGTNLGPYQRSPLERLHGLYQNPYVAAATMVAPAMIDPYKHPHLAMLARGLQFGSMAAQVAGLFPSKKLQQYRETIGRVRGEEAAEKVRQQMLGIGLRKQPLYQVSNLDAGAGTPQLPPQGAPSV